MRKHLMKVAVAVSFIKVFSVGSVLAAQLCGDKNQFVGPCVSVRGKLFASNGTPSVHIIPNGSKLQLGVVNDGDVEDRALPTRWHN